MTRHVAGTTSGFRKWDMRGIVKPDFFLPFAGGFVLGTIGLFAMQPADATQGFAQRIGAIVHQQR
ncbi:hypothetical protein [uncultured Sphingomonas sp.]|uniref:hypothetical protein n=1 Tax=uncultured Sphingomonas sp. TaxID=158754 RepID=UPI0035C9A4D2